jgi:AraC-like DNA-binding protein
VDALTDLLSSARAEGALFGQTYLAPPWSLRFAVGAPLTLVTMARGDGWLVPAGEQPVRLATGDLAIVNGTEPFTVADEPATAPQIVVHPDDRCTDPDGGEPDDLMHLGPRTCGFPADGPSLLVTGTYQVSGAISRRLLDGLPPVLAVAAGDIRCRVAEVALAEIGVDEPGQQVILDRLLDVLLVSALRAWFTRPGADDPGWYRALADPVVGPALGLLHENPAHPWTVGALAEKVGISRAAFARRFRTTVGEGPMSYLTSWRICLAADRLRDSTDTVDAIARRVGYANAFALSVAFNPEFSVVLLRVRLAVEAGKRLLRGGQFGLQLLDPGAVLLAGRLQDAANSLGDVRVQVLGSGHHRGRRNRQLRHDPGGAVHNLGLPVRAVLRSGHRQGQRDLPGLAGRALARPAAGRLLGGVRLRRLDIRTPSSGDLLRRGGFSGHRAGH